MATVRVESEQETQRGWLYRLAVLRDDGSESLHDVRLAWVDHDHWSGGRVAPSRVVEAVVRYVLERASRPLPPSFDAALARRWLPQIDRELREGAVG